MSPLKTIEARPALGRQIQLLPYEIPSGETMTAEPLWPLLDFSWLNGERARRVLNVAVALAALVLFSPLMLLIAVAVKLTSRGPVIYTQPRIGADRRNPNLPSGNWRRTRDLGGRPFTIFKFRTMYDAGDSRQVWATPGDPRVTPIGRVLRKYRLDELPQLVNVIRGEMNIVGPRPEQPALFAEFRERLPDYQMRQRVLPGITGWAQVNQSYDTCLDDVRSKLRYDLRYIEGASALEDLRIMVRTLPIVVGRKGAW